MGTKQVVYLDYAAATPISPEVRKAMEPYFSANFYNPSAGYLAAQKIAKDINWARSSVAKILGAKTDEVVFTAGGTEANNLAINGVMDNFKNANLLFSALEHESVRASSGKYKSKEVAVDKQGRLDLNDLKKKIDSKTVLVSVMMANNEIGTIQPIREISQLIKQIRDQRATNSKIKNTLPLYLHVDAAQAANYLDLQVARLGVDLMSLNGGKIYGPKQTGALYIKAGVRLNPQIVGGGQEMGLRSGTENVAGVIGFATALKEAQTIRKQESVRLGLMLQACIKLFSQEAKTKITVNGSIKYRLPNNLHITVAGADNERLMMQLDELGIMCATGSACSASKDEPSHVLKAIGLSDKQARSSLRFTFGRQTTPEDIKYLVNSLQKITTKP